MIERVKIGITGHSIVRRLTNYALLQRSMNLNFNPVLFKVTFVTWGGLKVQPVYTLMYDILNASRAVI